MGDFLNIHAAFGRYDERDPAAGAIDQQGKVEFLVDVGAVGDVEAVDLLARVAGLDRHQRVAQHVGRVRLDLIQIEGEANAALGFGGQFLELALAAATGMDLRLYDIKRSGQLLGGLDRFLDQGLTALGDKLGPINWQFMATKKFDPVDFEGFLKLLP